MNDPDEHKGSPGRKSDGSGEGEGPPGRDGRIHKEADALRANLARRKAGSRRPEARRDED